MALVSVNVAIGGGGNATPTSYILFSDTTKTSADITTALGLAGGAHDSTPELNTIQTDVNALATASGGHVHVVWDNTKCTTKNQMRSALQAVLAMIDAGSLLTG